MTKKYHELAELIVDELGGKENILTVYHCQTRLRFTLRERNIVEYEKVEALNGVTKVLESGGQIQVVIGTHVADVFEEVATLVDLSKGNNLSNEKKKPFETIIDFIAGTFQPIIPALSGAGMVKVVLALLIVFKIITPESLTYYMLNVFADGVFYFLPIMVAFTEAQKLKVNPILAAGVAAMMLHPNWINLVTAGNPVLFFDILPFTLASYSSSVIPIIIIVFVQSYIEKYLNRVVPKSINLVFVPMLTFLIMGILAFSLLGPIGAVIGNYLADIFTFLAENASWAPALLIGSFLPVMVMFGIHNGIAPLGIMQMSQLGFDSIFGPGALVSNMAQATAGAVVALMSKDKKIKETAIPGSITAFMGITEPLLYGVNLPKRYPLFASMAGGGLGGLYAGLTHTHRFATGSSGLPAILLYIGDNTMQFFYNIIIAILITIISTAIITFILAKRFEKNKEYVTVLEKMPVITGEEVLSPVTGQILPLSAAVDEVFSSRAVGDGVVIIPEESTIYAPFDGIVSSIFPSKHAIGLISDKGAEVLIHIGINTVNLAGQGFEAFVKDSDRVVLGQALIKFDMSVIEEAGLSTQTMVIVTNKADYSEITFSGETYSRAKSSLMVLKK